MADLQSVAEKVNKLAEQQKQEDEILAEVPDEYLDPIMSTLMTDPVLLPSSRQIVDRSTIARYYYYSGIHSVRHLVSACALIIFRYYLPKHFTVRLIESELVTAVFSQKD